MNRVLPLLVGMALAAVTPVLAQKQEIKEMQRDVLMLQDQLRTMQRAQDEKFAELKALLQSAIEQMTRTNSAVAVLESTIKDRLREQEKSIAAPVAGLSGKVDSFTEDLRYFKEAIGELDGKMGKLQLKLVDIENAIKVSAAPAAPPPTAGGAPAGTPDTPPPGTSADALYQDALRDKNAGNYELALNELTSFLKWYSMTDLAPNAQFWIGDIYFNKKQYEDALAAFDAVLTKFGKNNKLQDAHYMKGRALAQLGRKTEAASAFREAIRTAPRGERAASACSALKDLGYSCSAAAPAPPSRGRKK